MVIYSTNSGTAIAPNTRRIDNCEADQAKHQLKKKKKVFALWGLGHGPETKRPIPHTYELALMDIAVLLGWYCEVFSQLIDSM